MEVPFEQLPDTARVWIYQADKPFTKSEREIISTNLSSFLQQWTAHGATLQAGFTLSFDHFIVIGLNENNVNASGCSIDGLFRNLQGISQQTGIDFLNRELVAFKVSEGVSLVKRTQVKDALAVLGADALTFNNLVSTKQEWQKAWVVPANTTWLKRYIAPISV